MQAPVDNIPEHVARAIVDHLGSKGLPPDPRSATLYSVGLDDEISTLKNQFLGVNGAIGSAPVPGFSVPTTYSYLISARNGEGKTHFVYTLLAESYRLGYVGSYVELDATNAPLSDDFLLYKAVVGSVRVSDGSTVNMNKKGLDAVLQAWVEEKLSALKGQGIDAEAELEALVNDLDIETPRIDYRRGIKEYLKRLVRGDRDGAELVYGWLAGQLGPPKLVDGTAFAKLDSHAGDQYIACVSRVLRALGFTGFLLVFDEAETAVLPTREALERGGSRKKALSALFNFLKLIRQPQNLGIDHSLVIYCTTDAVDSLDLHPALRTAFLEPRSVFSSKNPSGSIVDLAGKLDGSGADSLYLQLATKLARLYVMGYESSKGVKESDLEQVCQYLATVAGHRVEATGRMRLFVRAAVSAFHTRADGEHLDEEAVRNIMDRTSQARHDDSEGGGLAL